MVSCCRCGSPGKARRWLVFAILCGVAGVGMAWAGGLFNSARAQAPRSQGPAGDSLAGLVANLRKEKDLVGLAAIVVVDREVVAKAADGVRKAGSGVPLELDDRWHLGSVTKSITATMIARLIESGQMQWTETIEERFPDDSIHGDWKSVTLEQLLTHTSGARANFPLSVRLKQPARGSECTRERREVVLDIIAEKPAHTPGEKYSYSNVGYTIAGAMAEAATDTSWEELIREEVFEPLKLTGAGFGPPKSPAKSLDQPRGHRVVLGWRIGMDDDEDNTPIMSPAGAVHMTLDDLNTYLTAHLRGERGDNENFLSPESWKKLHEPRRDNYACGWVRKEPTFEIPHRLYWHNGSNTMWYTLAVFIPGKNMIVAVTSNDGEIREAESAAWSIVESMARQFNHQDDTIRRQSLPSGAFPKISPFAAVRWSEDQPEVRIGEKWFELVSLNDIPTAEIVTFCRESYEEKWQKRFEEDLVEALSRMGHEVKSTVRLVVRPPGTKETKTLEAIEMTEANRRAIRKAAAER